MPSSDSQGGLKLDPGLVTGRDRCRQTVLSVLEEASVPLTVSDLAHEMVEREHGVQAEPAASDTVRQWEITLYHNHLPRLADWGVVEFDPDRRLVAREQ